MSTSSWLQDSNNEVFSFAGTIEYFEISYQEYPPERLPTCEIFGFPRAERPIMFFHDAKIDRLLQSNDGKVLQSDIASSVLTAP